MENFIFIIICWRLKFTFVATFGLAVAPFGGSGSVTFAGSGAALASQRFGTTFCVPPGFSSFKPAAAATFLLAFTGTAAVAAESCFGAAVAEAA